MRRELEVKINLPETLSILLAELEDELENTLGLINQLKSESLSEEQLNTILIELGTSISHLHTHTEGLEELIDKFLFDEENTSL